MNITAIAFDPLLPGWILLLLGVVAGLSLLVGIARRARGIAWRLLAFTALALALANPSLVQERRETRRDVAVVVVDDSPSQAIGDRPDQTRAALARVQAAAAAMPDLELRVVHAGEASASLIADEGTQLFHALDRAMEDIPQRRFAGAVMITDGQVHDVPALRAGAAALPGPLPGPLHVLLTGHRNEADRRLVVVRAPGFGLVDKTVSVTIRIEDESIPANGPPVSVAVRRDGQVMPPLTLPANRDVVVPVPIQHGGQTFLELEAAAGPRELTLINNRAVIAINGVRDRLKVLLISGEPHAGERTWRNLLKVDPSVDLVHFTILRPSEKQDNTPINELSLIAFPVRELFEVKLSEFDLVIFDRYRRRNILPPIYLEAVARYVEKGGAVLEAAGPTFASPLSLYNSPLRNLLPAEPTGEVFEQGFRPHVTDLGRRHPVTADLEGAGKPGSEPSWGRWFRHVDVAPKRGNVVMSGVGERPLLILDRVGQGRIAQLASDHIWLWSRGFEGGGPQAELLRRLAHWLMKEPELEEEDLRATIANGRLLVARRSLGEAAAEAVVTDPAGSETKLPLVETAPGRAEAGMAIGLPGVYRIAVGERQTLVAAGSVNPKEFADVRASAAPLQPLVGASGGGLFWLEQGGGPDLRRVRPDRVAAGRDWFGLVQQGDYDVVGVDQTPLLPGYVLLLVGIGALMLAWRREGR